MENYSVCVHIFDGIEEIDNIKFDSYNDAREYIENEYKYCLKTNTPFPSMFIETTINWIK